jgi:hypothetical protein
MSPINDTSPEAERVLIDVFRRMPIAQKWRQMGVMFHTAKVLHAAGVRLRNPTATDQETRDSWTRLTLGEEVFQTLAEAKRGRRIDR